jgi:hypothetical protein
VSVDNEYYLGKVLASQPPPKQSESSVEPILETIEDLRLKRFCIKITVHRIQSLPEYRNRSNSVNIQRSPLPPHRVLEQIKVISDLRPSTAPAGIPFNGYREFWRGHVFFTGCALSSATNPVGAEAKDFVVAARRSLRHLKAVPGPFVCPRLQSIRGLKRELLLPTDGARIGASD